jgi:hypothetical protein
MVRTTMAVVAVLVISTLASASYSSDAIGSAGAIAPQRLESGGDLLHTLGLTRPALQKECCRICTKGKACGDSCIARDKVCHQPPGCACNGRSAEQ